VPDEQIHRVQNPFQGMTTEELLAEKRRLEIENRESMRLIEATSETVKKQQEIAKKIERKTSEYEQEFEAEPIDIEADRD
jgi:ppGpp synthetase/RelA/SpoT-type nucleotidyltranferase